MPLDTGAPSCRAISASAASELAWVLNLLTQTARYAEPALAELDGTLLPGVGRLRAPIGERSRQLWQDEEPGCAELLLCAHLAGGVLDDEPSSLFSWLRAGAARGSRDLELITEAPRDRAAILARLRRLRSDARARQVYLGMLHDVWSLVSPAWDRRGREVVRAACAAWEARLDTGARIDELLPPRHPLTRADKPELDALFARRPEFVLSPVYFCMSGGHVMDLNDHLHIAVPASDLLPARKVRDAMYVADRLRVLAEPTRVRILLQMMAAPAGVMELSRSLRLSQPTVSAHLKVLLENGLVKAQKRGGRSAYAASGGRVERLLEDARATLARWA